jgi:ACT domain-containing protein
MEKQRFKTKSELIEELGLSRSTFYRLLEKKNIQTSRQMLCPKEENELRLELGFPPLPGFESPLKQDETR